MFRSGRSPLIHIVTRTIAMTAFAWTLHPAGAQTLDGCGLPLPGATDRDSGLGERIVQNRQGQRFLLAPSLTVGHTSTDNLELATDRERESSNISKIVPAVTFCQNRKNLRTQIDYRAELRYYPNERERTDVRHQFNTINTAELLDQTAFFDLEAQLDQWPLSADAPRNENDPRASEDVFNLRASPYINQDLGQAGSLQARYAHESRYYEDSRARDTDRQIGSIRLTSPAAADPISWVGSVRSERIERDEASRSEEGSYLDDAFIELGYRVRGGLTLTARGGAETDLSNDSEDRFGDEYWETGGRWSNGRSRIEARIGRRFFDETFFAAVSHRAGRITGNLSYRESQDVRADENNPESDVALSQRLNISAVYERGRSRVNVNFFDDRADFIRTGEERDRIGVNTRWQWRFQRRTTLTPAVEWDRLDGRDGIKSDTYDARISLTRLLSRDMQAGITLRRQIRDSEESKYEYRENAVTLEITRVF